MELLKSGDEKTIIQIAFDSGFSSKSAFNKVFKEKTGLTPGEYKEKSG
jgi:AraC-like DNA-binding protein